MSEKKPMLRSDYRPLDFKITTTDLTVELDSPITTVRSVLKLERTNPQATSFMFNGQKLSLHSLKVNGQAWDNYTLETVNERQGFQELTIDISELSNQDSFTVEIENSFDLDNNLSLSGIYKAGNHICSQCEAEGFRLITFYFDRPDNLSIFTCKVIGDKTKYPHLLSNGNPVEQGDLDNNRHYALWSDPFPKPSYLFALVAGEFDTVKGNFTTKSGRDIDIVIYGEVGKGKQLTHALSCIKRAMKWDEDRFGLEYDLDLFMIVAVSFFNMGAMENKGLNIFNDAALLGDKDTATDTTLERIDAIIAHEYFHNWTGDRVTCRDWFQLTLKEGLTVFRDQEYSSDTLDRTTSRINSVNTVRTVQFEEDQGPTSHPIRPEAVLTQDNFYTATVYRKGAEVIRMIHTLLGEENFQAGMRLYFERHDGKAVTCDDFVDAMADASGINLDHFRLWYSQSGTPTVTVSKDYNPQTKVLTLNFAQKTLPTNDQKDKQALYFPFKTILMSKAGEVLTGLKTTDGKDFPELFIIDKENQTLEVANLAEEPIVVTNCNFSAPVRVKEELSYSDLAVIATSCPDEFSRYAAMMTAYNRLYDYNIERLAKGLEVEVPETIFSIYQAVLDTALERKHLASQMLYFPCPSTVISNYSADVNPVALSTIAREVRLALSKRFADKAKKLFLTLEQNSWAYEVEQFGTRALRATLLRLMTARGENKELVEELYNKADNLTDRLSAISANFVNHLGLDSMVVAFLEQYKDNTLVLDHYLGLVANNALTLEQVKEVTKFHSYDATNPNRVKRVLFGLRDNYSLFYKEDGSVLAYVADETLRCDNFNPQLASNIVSFFLNFFKLAQPYSALVFKEVERLAQENNSNNVQEKLNMALKMAKGLKK